MAYTASLIARTVFGNEAVQQYVVTTDAVSGTVATGFKAITQLHWSPASVTTNGSGVYPRVRMNAIADGTATNGTVGFSGLVSGDVLYLTVYGR